MTLKALQAPPDSICYEVHRLMCLSAKEGDGAAFSELGVQLDTERTLLEVQNGTKAIVDAYSDRRREDALKGMAIGASFEFVKGVLSVGTKLAAPATMGASLALEGVNYGVGKLMDFTLEAYEKSAAESAGRYMMNKLQAMRADGMDLERFKTMDPREAVAEILTTQTSGTVPVVDVDQFMSLDDNGRPFLNHHSIEQLKALVAQNEELNDFVDAQQQVKIEVLEQDMKDMKGMAGALLEVQKQGTEHLQALTGTVGEIKKDVEELTEMVGENADGVAFLKEFMFGKMTPEEQLRALENGQFILPDQASKEKALKILVNRRELVGQANKYLNGANIVAGVLGQAGILKPELVEDINKAANTGLAVVNGLSSLASGNYLGAISALGSLMGIWGNKGPDVATLRHQQIMKQFDRLHEGQQKIMENQAKLMKGQQEIMRLQVETYKAIQTLAKRIEERFDEVMDKLGRIHHDVLVNRRMILALLTDDLDAGHKFLQDMEAEGGEDFDPEHRRFTSYPAMQSYFSGAVNYANFARGIDAIEDARPDSGQVDVRLRLENYDESKFPGKKTGVADYLDAYRQTLSVASLATGGAKDLAASLLLPVANVSHLDKKETDLDVAEADLDLLNFVIANIDKPFSVDALSKVYGLLLGLQVYYQLQNAADPTELYGYSDLEKKARLSGAGLIRLKEALQAVDTAIAQQSLFAGDALLPTIEDSIEAVVADPTLVDKPAYVTVLEALKKNGLLRRNLAAYLTHHAVYQGGGNKIYTYQVASNMSAKYPTYLEDIFGPGYSFKHEPSEDHDNPWLIVLPGDLTLRLPSAEKLQHGGLEHTSEMQDLLTLRAQLLDAIMSHEWPEDMSEDERAMAFDLNVLGSLDKA